MWKRLTQLGLAAVVAIVVLVLLIPSGDAIAFADVLEYIKSPGYTFDVSIQVEAAHSTARGMVLRPGRVRFEHQMGVGEISQITDVPTRRNLLLFHQFKMAQLFDMDQESDDIGVDMLRKLCSGPIENFWNLQDGTEQDLGQKTIDGVAVHGFRVADEDTHFSNEIKIWAEAQTARPLEVIITSTAQKPPYGQLTWTLTNFDLDAELDESLFSMEPPAGYILSGQLKTEDFKSQGQASPEALKVVEALSLWKEGQEDRAVETILGVQWDKPLQFAKEPYIFGVTEKDYLMLDQADQVAVMGDLMPDCGHVREFCFKLKDIALAAREQKDYAKAERHLETMSHWGGLLIRDPEGLLIVKLVGIAVQKLALVQLKELYEVSEQSEKLIEIHKRIQKVDAYHRDLVASVKAR